MGRRKNKTKTKKTAARGGSNGITSSKEVVDEEYVGTKKKVYVSFSRYGKPPRWMEIDPHYYEHDEEKEEENCFAVERMPKINSPPSDLFISKLTWYTPVVYKSKVFFIGGKIPRKDYLPRPPEVFSDKFFTYHLLSDQWEEWPCRLSIARTNPIVVVVDNYMYVFGGYTCSDGLRTKITNKEHWIERFNLHSKKKNAKWEFLPPASAAPDEIYQDYIPMYHFVYGSQVYFVTKESGCYSLDCNSKTWAPLDQNISNTLPYVKCEKVVVIDHLLFCHYYGVIYAYDLVNKSLVLSQRLDQLKMSFGILPEPHFRYWYPAMSFLEHIGKDTLLLVRRHCNSDDRDKDLHFYKFQIQNDDPVSCNNLRLVQTGCGLFPATTSFILNVIAA